MIQKGGVGGSGGSREGQGLSAASELGLTWQDSLQAPVREGASALTTMVLGWLLDGKVLWWKALGLGGEMIVQILPDA